MLGIQAMTIVLSLVEVFSGAPSTLKIDVTHTGLVNAVSLVTCAGYEPPRSAWGIHFLSASYMPSCASLPALVMMVKMMERQH